MPIEVEVKFENDFDEFSDFIKKLGKEGFDEVIRETYTELAVEARRAQRKEIERVYEEPKPGTVNGVIFRKATFRFGVVRSEVLLKDFVANFLAHTIVEGGFSTENTRHGKDDILVPVINVLRSNKVPASMNKFGNIKSFKGGAVLTKLFNDKRVFNISPDSSFASEMTPGIYFRGNKAGDPLVVLFTYVDSVDNEEIYDFFRINEKIMESKVEFLFFRNLDAYTDKECKL